jgi:hypothetical protein
METKLKPVGSMSAVEKAAFYAEVHADALVHAKYAFDTVYAGMYVAEEHESPLDDSSPVVKTSAPFELEGFAWVIVKPGNAGFGNWLRKTGNGKTDSYYGGIRIWVSGRGYERKTAYANAYAARATELLARVGDTPRIFPGSRLD